MSPTPFERSVQLALIAALILFDVLLILYSGLDDRARMTLFVASTAFAALCWWAWVKSRRIQVQPLNTQQQPMNAGQQLVIRRNRPSLRAVEFAFDPRPGFLTTDRDAAQAELQEALDNGRGFGDVKVQLSAEGTVIVHFADTFSKAELQRVEDIVREFVAL